MSSTSCSVVALTVAIIAFSGCGSVKSTTPDAQATPADSLVADSPAADSAPPIDASLIDSAPPPDAACSTTMAIDQQLGACQSPPIAQCTSAFILHNGQSAAQAFVPGVDGMLGMVRVRMSNGAAGTDEVELALVEATTPDALVDPTFDVVGHTRASTRSAMTIAMAWQTVTFNPAPAVVAGRTYFLIARLVGVDPGSAMALWDEYNDFQGNQVDSYRPGRSFSCGTGCATWIEEPTFRDHAFETYVTVTTCGP